MGWIHPSLIGIILITVWTGTAAGRTVVEDHLNEPSPHLTIRFDGGWTVEYGRNPNSQTNSITLLEAHDGTRLIRNGGETGEVKELWLFRIADGKLVNAQGEDRITDYRILPDGAVRIRYRKSGPIETRWEAILRFSQLKIADHRYGSLTYLLSVFVPQGYNVSGAYPKNNLWRMADLALDGSLEGTSLFLLGGGSSKPMGVYHLRDGVSVIEGEIFRGIPGLTVQPFILLTKGTDRAVLVHPVWLFHPDFTSLREEDPRGNAPVWSAFYRGRYLEVDMRADLNGRGGGWIEVCGMKLLYSDEPYRYLAQIHLDAYRYISDYLNRMTGTRWNPYVAELVPEDTYGEAVKGGAAEIIRMARRKRWGEFGYGHCILPVWRLRSEDGFGELLDELKLQEIKIAAPFEVDDAQIDRAEIYEELLSRWEEGIEGGWIDGAVAFDFGREIGGYDRNPQREDPSQLPISKAPYGIAMVRDLQRMGLFFYGGKYGGPFWGDMLAVGNLSWRAFFRVEGEEGSGTSVPPTSLLQYEHTDSPKVVRFEPGDGAVGVPKDFPITIGFDVPLDPDAFLFRVKVNGQAVRERDLRAIWLDGNRTVRIEHPLFPDDAFVELRILRAREGKRPYRYLEGMEFMGGFAFGWKGEGEDLFMYHRYKYGGRPYRSSVACSLVNISCRNLQVGFADRFGYPPDRILLLGKGRVEWERGGRRAPFPKPNIERGEEGL